MRSVWLRRPSLRITLVRCASTVRALSESRSALSVLLQLCAANTAVQKRQDDGIVANALQCILWYGDEDVADFIF